MFVLSGKAAEFLAILNEQAPSLPYYDLIIRMERFMKAHEQSEQVCKNQTNLQILTNRPSLSEHRSTCSICETPYYQHYEKPAWFTLRQGSQQYTPFREPCHQQRERYMEVAIDSRLSIANVRYRQPA
ncbi:MAG: hypothetical protein AB2693_15675, partial [Candidatus Thiodiazotropha sp.]